MYDRAKRMRELSKQIKEGNTAKDLISFAKKFQEIEEAGAIQDMLGSTKPPEIIRQDLRAVNRFVSYLIGVVQRGNLAEEKLERMKE